MNVVDDLPQTDMAEKCPEHASCIRAFKRRASGPVMPLAGWWHLIWDQENSQWNLTAPNGKPRYVVVQYEDAPYPPAALIDAVPGLTFEPIIRSIEEQGLFPPQAS